jgi:hypothetical protein
MKKGVLLNTYLLNGADPFWEANRFLASQEITSILRNLKLYYHIHECPPPVRILSHIDSLRAPTFNSLKIHLNIILSSMPGSYKLSLSFRFSHQNTVYPNQYNAEVPE